MLTCLSACSFQIEKGSGVAESQEARAAAERARFIWHLPGGGRTPGILKAAEAERGRRKGCTPTVVFAPVDEPLEEALEGRELPFRCAGFAPRSQPVTRGPASWDPELAPGRGGKPCCLDLDLGRTVHVSALATQGAPPPTRRYPEVRRHAEEDWVEDRPSASGRRYAGPFWTVLDPNQHNPALRPRDRLLRWVRRFELQWRADGGRAWNSLGFFGGNGDATAERVHDLTKLPGQGLWCRHLRIIPSETENGGGLRVQVYGAASHEGQGGEGTEARPQAAREGRGRASRASRASSSKEVGSDEHFVEYTLTRPAHTGRKPLFVAEGGFCYRDDWHYFNFERDRALGKRQMHVALGGIQKGRNDPIDADVFT